MHAVSPQPGNYSKFPEWRQKKVKFKIPCFQPSVVGHSLLLVLRLVVISHIESQGCVYLEMCHFPSRINQLVQAITSRYTPGLS